MHFRHADRRMRQQLEEAQDGAGGDQSARAERGHAGGLHRLEREFGAVKRGGGTGAEGERHFGAINESGGDMHGICLLCPSPRRVG